MIVRNSFYTSVSNFFTNNIDSPTENETIVESKSNTVYIKVIMSILKQKKTTQKQRKFYHILQF